MFGNQLQRTHPARKKQHRCTYIVFGDVDQEFAFKKDLKREALVLQFVDELDDEGTCRSREQRERTSRAEGVRPVCTTRIE